jgi:hypothetical protein
VKKLLVFTAGIIAFVSFSMTAFAARNSVTNVRASQRSDGTNYVDIYYDLEAIDPRECRIRYSFDGGSIFRGDMTSLSGDTGENVPPGNNKHVVWDAGRMVPDVISECQIRVIVTFWVGYPKIPIRLTKSVPDNGDGDGQAESATISGVPDDIMGENTTGERKPSDTLVKYFQKLACHRIVRQSDSLPFQLNTVAEAADIPVEPDIPDEPDMPDAPDAPKEPAMPVLVVNTQLEHAPTLDEWGMIVFFILLLAVSASKLRSTHPH